jgi:hypothetical protein
MSAWNNFLLHTGVQSWDESYRQEIKASFENLMPKINNLNTNQLENLQTIFMTLKKTDALLKPLKEAGLKYELAVAGGSVYDFVLRPDAPMSDCDVIIYCQDVTNINMIREKPEVAWENLVHKHLPEKLPMLRVYEKESQSESTAHMLPHLQAPATVEGKPKGFSYNNDVFVDLIAKLISDSKHHDYEIYRKDNDLVKDYLSNLIAGIIKLNAQPHEKNTVKTDLIISSVRPADFVLSFDFDICKAYMNFSDDSQSCFELLDNLILHPSCIYDAEDKTLSINCRNFTPEHVEYFLSKHYLKMKEKFPGYQLKFYAGTIEENKTPNPVRPHVAVYGAQYLKEEMKIASRHYILQEKMKSWDLPEAYESSITKLKI